MPEIINTKYGKVRGEALDGKYEGIYLYKGIPYAAPPVGRLRWAPPEEPEPWQGVRDCTEYAPAPIQLFADLSAGSVQWTIREFHLSEYPPQSEDCLYLNICTPAKSSGEKLPVYIWYHGGGLVNGFSYEVEFDPAEMAKNGAVVVQVGTRLNVFGYLALPQLTSEQGSSGNYGLMDQLIALKWIYENIAEFGGDPENITAGGESGGCTKATTIAMIPASQGRVKRVINQSGNQWMRGFSSQERAEAIGRKYLEFLGIDPNTPVDELRKLDANVIFSPDVPREITPNDMVCDGILIKGNVRECLEACPWDVDFLNGSNCGEADVFSKQWWEYDHIIDTPDKFRFFYRGMLGKMYDKYNFESQVPGEEEKIWVKARRLASLGLSIPGAGTSSRNLMLNRLFGKYLADHGHGGSKVYSYLWSYIPPCNPEDIGGFFDPDKMMSFHGSELWFTFNSLREGRPPVRPWKEKDFKIGDMVCKYWVNFMRTGDPNGEGLPYWPASDESLGYIEIGDEAVGHSGLEDDLDRLLYEYNVKAYNI